MPEVLIYVVFALLVVALVVLFLLSTKQGKMIRSLKDDNERFFNSFKENNSSYLKDLSQNLKELEADDLIIRTVYPQIPPKVEYSLTERGHSLVKVLDLLCDWGNENRIR